MEQNLVLCKRTENAGFDKKRGPGNSWGGGGGSVWVVFPWKMFTTLSSASSTDGIFVPPRRELLRSMTAAYPSSSHFKLSLVLSLPLIFT